MARLSFRCPDDLVTRVDVARGREPREAWLRRVVESSVTELGLVEQPVVDRQAAGSSPVVTAEQLGRVPGPNVENIRSSAQAKRDVRAIPKRAKP